MKRVLRRAKRAALPSASCSRNGFVLSLEAASSLALLLIAASALALFSFQEANAGDFYACSDAALLLSKSHAFSDGTLGERVAQVHSLTGMCAVASSPAASSSSCGGARDATEKFSFTMPVWQQGGLRSAKVECWRA